MSFETSTIVVAGIISRKSHILANVRCRLRTSGFGRRYRGRRRSAQSFFACSYDVAIGVGCGRTGDVDPNADADGP